MTTENQVLDAQALRALAERHTPKACDCSLGACEGWESVSGDRWPEGAVQQLGSLRATLDADGSPLPEPSFAEFHPAGTRYESPEAPIAPQFFPYNRCDVFACGQCDRVLLKYTEFGGYYVDHRVRVLNPERVTDAPLPDAD
ncbi:hypothetical protein [Limnohabitans sp. Rim8]|uniref:hypothetical protein n=1 Tax=Limnohabitans sp. Rim8 TaxID=1100718 RepID=UPI00261F24C5|nr:hypothetical protein [Limnohabitans sp. Rim8]